jgi:hypothetical protein
MKSFAAKFIKPNNRLSSFERLEINNRCYWFRVLDCFYDDYPGLLAILGNRKFLKLATVCLERYPSESFTLRNLGSRRPKKSQSKLPGLPKTMFESAPDGYFLRDLIVFHGLRKGCNVSKGFLVEPADLSAVAPEHLNAFQDQLALLLACLHDKLRLQVQWFCDSDYRSELLRYREETQGADIYGHGVAFDRRGPNPEPFNHNSKRSMS